MTDWAFLAKMNVLFFADHVHKDLAGGGQTVAWELSRRLVRVGHSVSFIVNASKEGAAQSEVIEGTRILRVRKGLGLFANISERRRLLNLLRTESPVDLIHSHFAYSEIGVSRPSPKSVPWLRSFYGPWDEEGWVEDSKGSSGLLIKERIKRFLRKQIEQRSLKRAKSILYLSEFTRSQLRRVGVDEAKMRYAPGGCDVQRFHPLGSREEARQRLGILTKGPLLLSIRRLVPRMGLDRLIEAVTVIRRQYPDVLLMIGGRGPEAESFSRQIEALGLQDHVRMLGFIPDDQLADHYRAADLFILPSLALEGFGLVTVDALACGTPVLGTPSGATPEILNRIDPRLILAGSASTDIARGVEQFFAEDWRLGLTSERLHRIVKNNYTWDLHFDAVLAVYQSLLTPKTN